MPEKLIRQNINLPPDVMTRKAHPDELDKLLGQKLIEESRELADVLNLTPTIRPTDAPMMMEAGERKRHMVDEAADVIEVLNTVLWRHGIHNATVALRLEQKHEERGGFIDRVLVDAPAPDRESKLQCLVEDMLGCLSQMTTGVLDQKMVGMALDQLHWRAYTLGCLGTNAKPTRR